MVFGHIDGLPEYSGRRGTTRRGRHALQVGLLGVRWVSGRRTGEDTGPYEWSIGCAADDGRRGAQCALRQPLPDGTAAFAALGQRNDHQVSEASRATQAERQRRFTKRLKTGGLSKYHLLCENSRRSDRFRRFSEICWVRGQKSLYPAARGQNHCPLLRKKQNQWTLRSKSATIPI